MLSKILFILKLIKVLFWLKKKKYCNMFRVNSKIVVDEELVISRSGKEATMIQKAMSNYYFANDHKEELYSFQAISNLHRNREKVSII